MSDQTFTQADVDRIVKERLAAEKTAAATRLAEANTQIDDWKKKATEYEAAAKKSADLERELTGIKTAAERAQVWDAAAVPAELRARLEKIYESDTAAEPKPLAEWLEASKEDPLISRVLGVAQPVAPGSGQGAPPAAPGPVGSPKPVAPPTGVQPRVQQADPRATIRAEHAKLLAAGQLPEARAVLKQLADLPAAG